MNLSVGDSCRQRPQSELLQQLHALLQTPLFWTAGKDVKESPPPLRTASTSLPTGPRSPHPPPPPPPLLNCVARQTFTLLFA